MMSRILPLVLILVLLVPAAADAKVKPTNNEKVVGWTTKKSTLKRGATKLPIAFKFNVCGTKRPNSISRIVVERTAKKVTITVLMTKIPKGGPYAICPKGKSTFKKTVKLKGKLGGRSVVDGKSGAVRVARP